MVVNYDDLFMFIICCLVDRDDFFVVGIWGVRGVILLFFIVFLFVNMCIVDYLFYDVFFLYVVVFVINGGYGSVIYVVMNGILVVFVGVSEDKFYVVVLLVWVGIGVNLGIGWLSEE